MKVRDEIAAAGATGAKIVALRGDVRKTADIDALVRRATEELGPIDILVNNAGTIARAPAVDHDDETWDSIIEINLTAPFILTRELGRGMVERGAGKVIFTASLLSFQGGILVPSYTASKSGIAGLVKAFSNEWAPHGVNVNGITPGYIATDNTEALRADPDRSRSILERIPAGRWGAAEDLAGATLFLASPASDYVCGIVLPVDGGWLAR
jgi:2-deoxy-D-gluconate 3-dehydrogenase